MTSTAETELFDTHHRRYCEAATSVHNMMDRLGSDKYAREQDSLVEQIESKLREMDQQLKRMALERGQMFNPATAQSCEQKMRSLQADANNLKQTFNSKRAQSSRSKLYAGSSSMPSSAHAVRGQLLANQTALDRSAARLEAGISALDETEQIGGSVLQNLAQQRETLEHSQGVLNSADERLTVARKHLVAMGRRLAAHKAAMYCVIGILVMIVVFLIVRKFS
jgi:vesicle transport through interaction with t-SNAREs 1